MSIELDRSQWRPLNQADLTKEFVEQLNADEPNRSVIIAWFIANFEKQTGLIVDNSNSLICKIYSQWVTYQQTESDIPLLIRKYPRLHNIIFANYSSKISLLSQRHCYICQPDGPIYVMPIRITPRSRQNIEKIDRRAFHSAIAHWFSCRQITIDASSKICLAVTFVLGKNGRDKDLDNMIKILQYAIAEALNFNDRHVQHLDLLKLIMQVEEEYVYVRIMKSRVNDDHDVLVPIEHHLFACGPALRLENFL